LRGADDPLDLADADLAGDVVTITLPWPQARALATAARFAQSRGFMLDLALDAGLAKLGVAVGDDRPDRLGPMHHESVVDCFNASRTRTARSLENSLASRPGPTRGRRSDAGPG
jgi:hypothetical protein